MGMCSVTTVSMKLLAHVSKFSHRYAIPCCQLMFCAYPSPYFNQLAGFAALAHSRLPSGRRKHKPWNSWLAVAGTNGCMRCNLQCNPLCSRLHCTRGQNQHHSYAGCCASAYTAARRIPCGCGAEQAHGPPLALAFGRTSPYGWRGACWGAWQGNEAIDALLQYTEEQANAANPHLLAMVTRGQGAPMLQKQRPPTIGGLEGGVHGQRLGARSASPMQCYTSICFCMSTKRRQTPATEAWKT